MANTAGNGDGGNVEIYVNRLKMEKTGEIITGTDGSGSAGSVFVRAAEKVYITGHDEKYSSGFSADTEKASGGGAAGNIRIITPELVIDDGGRIFSGTKGDGPAGKVTLETDNLTMSESAHISTASTGTGTGGSLIFRVKDSVQMKADSAITSETENADGGNISVQTGKTLNLQNSAITTSVKGGTGNGGNIEIKNVEIGVLNNSRISANAHGGQGGNIHIAADHFLKSANSVVEASSRFGIDGTIVIDSPADDLSGGMAVLPGNFPDASRLMKTPCAQRSGTDVSRFLSRGRDALPVSPDDWLPRPPLFSRLENLKDPFIQGDFRQVLQSGKEILSNQKENPETGMDALLFMADAYRQMGRYTASDSLLKEVINLAEKRSDTDRKALAHSALSDIYLSLQEMGAAQQHSDIAEQAAAESKDPAVKAAVWNNRGNLLAVEAQRRRSARDRYEMTVKDHYERALSAYGKGREEIEKIPAPSLFQQILRSNLSLNMARASIERKRMDDPSLPPDAFSQALKTAHSDIESLPESHSKAWNGCTFSRLAAMTGNITGAVLALERAKETAENIGDDRAGAYAHLYLSGLYAAEGLHDEALHLTRKATFLAQRIDAPEIRYLCRTRLAAIHQKRGDSQGAIEEYEAAMNILYPECSPDRETPCLSGIIQEVFNGGYRRGDFSFFREEVKPVYTEQARLLLEAGDSDARLIRAWSVMERLKSAELQDFYQDECIGTEERAGMRIEQIPQKTAVVYPILLPDRPVILLAFHDGIRRVEVPADIKTEQVKHTAAKFSSALREAGNLSRIESDGRRLYQWLILPFEAELKKREIDTLVIAADDELRLVSFAALYDGEQYLAEKYAIVNTPSLMLTDITHDGDQPPAALLSGLSEARQGFSALPNVENELQTVRSLIGGRMLLNREYTAENLEAELQGQGYSHIIISTHGVFGRTPNETYLLTYDESLSMEQLKEIVGIGKFREMPVDILTLSACETAVGDIRAALGLAGIAIKAGAKTALASLWQVEDESTAILIAEFYRQIASGRVSKALALQNAQKKLMQSGKYRHPFYWAPFLLIGNWS